jgi:hypothetical protein
LSEDYSIPPYQRQNRKTSLEVILTEKGFHVEGNAHNWSIHEIMGLGESCSNKKERGSYIPHLVNSIVMKQNYTHLITVSYSK